MTKKRLLLNFTVFLFLLTGCQADNVPDCLKYVDAYNEAYSDCDLSEKLNVDDTCSADAINDGRDCIAHYKALTNNLECRDSRVERGEIPECTNIPESSETSE